jgi:predicted RNase H-like HicB family nuclease
MKFQVIFTFDSDDQGYLAEVPALPGWLSQGKSLDEAIANIRDVIQGYLLVQAKHGKPITQPNPMTICLGEVAV